MGWDCEGSCMVGITSWKRKRREKKVCGASCGSLYRRSLGYDHW